MRYVIHCRLPPKVAAYQQGLLDAVADRFGLTYTRQQAIPPHFTLKYEFETEAIDELEERIERFCRAHGPAPLEVGGAGRFEPDVAFLEVHLSPAARQLFEALIADLREVPWLTWSRFDAPNHHFYATVAERCRDRLPEVMAFLRGQEGRFACTFDNVTLLRQGGWSTASACGSCTAGSSWFDLPGRGG